MLSNISISKDEEQDKHDLDIDIVPQNDPYPSPSPILNQNPKWVEKLIKVAGNFVGDPDDRRRTRSQY